MAMDMWENMIGKKCKKCTRPATHYYGTTALCCQCNGGHIVCNREATCVHWLFRLLQPDDSRCEGLTFAEDEVYSTVDDLLMLEDLKSHEVYH